VKLAVVLFNLGGPDSLAAVQPFLQNLFSDPAIIRYMVRLVIWGSFHYGTAPGKIHQRTTALPQVNPEPKAVMTRTSPGARRPALTHSSKPMGMVAAVVLP